MLAFIIRRTVAMVLTLFAVSIVAFAIIQLPPGDYLTSYIASLSATGDQVDPRVIENLRIQYGLGEPASGSLRRRSAPTSTRRR